MGIILSLVNLRQLLTMSSLYIKSILDSPTVKDVLNVLFSQKSSLNEIIEELLFFFFYIFKVLKFS